MLEFFASIFFFFPSLFFILDTSGTDETRHPTIYGPTDDRLLSRSTYDCVLVCDLEDSNNHRIIFLKFELEIHLILLNS